MKIVSNKKGWAAVYVAFIVLFAFAAFVTYNKIQKKKMEEIDTCISNIDKIKEYFEQEIDKNVKDLIIYKNKSPQEWYQMVQEDFDIPECPSHGEYTINDEWMFECSKHSDLSKNFRYLKDIIESKTVVITKNDMQSKDIVFFNKARNYISLKEFSKALNEILSAINEKPNEAEYHYYAAECYNILKQSDQALNEINTAISLKPEKKYSALLAKIEDALYFQNKLSSYNRLKIIYLARNITGADQMYKMGIDGSNKQMLTDNFRINSMTIMPQARKILFSETDNIRLMDFNGSLLSVVLNNLKYNCFDLAVSPDERNIAFTSTRYEPGLCIFLKQLGGKDGDTECMKLVDFSYQPGKPIWTSKNQIAFLSGYDNMAEIKLIDIQKLDERPENLTNNEFIEETINFVKPRNLLSYSSKYFITTETGESIPSLREIFTVNLQTGKRENISKSVLDDAYPNWSEDGNWIAYAETNKNHERDIFVMRPDGTQKKRASFFQADPAYTEFYSKILFVPGSNNSLLIFSYGTSEKRNMYLSDTDTGKILQLTESMTDDTMFFIVEE